MNPKFSIVIPVYNVAPYLHACLDSVLAQTFTDWEAICIDDGSTDGSGTVLDEYSHISNRIKVFHQANIGVCRTRQKGLDYAIGQYITWLDPDDWIDSGYLDSFAQATKNGEIDFLWTNYVEVNKDSRKIITQTIERASWDGLLKGLYDCGIWGGVCGKAFRRDFIVEKVVRFIDKNIPRWEDLCFVVNALSKKPKVKYVEQNGYFYRQRDNSALRKSSIDLGEAFRLAVFVEEYIERIAPFEFMQVLYRERREDIKFSVCTCRAVSDVEFKNTFPEVKDLTWDKYSWVNKCVFLIALTSSRRLLVALFDTYRLGRKYLRAARKVALA